MTAESSVPAPLDRTVIVFAGALYDAPLWTNRQHIATRLANRGWRVLYVEPRLFLFPQVFGRFLGSTGRLRWLLRQIAPWQAHERLWVQAQANLVPGSRRFPAVGILNHRLWNAWHVRLHAWELGMHAPVLLVYDTEAAEFLDDFPDARVVYDCVDDHRAQAGVDRAAALVAREEEAIARRADAIAVTTKPLRDRFARLSRYVHLVPNAADVHAFLPEAEKVSGTFLEPADMRAIPHPRIGTCGALDAYKLDVGLIRAVAEQHPNWHFVLVGPVDVAGRGRSAIESLRALPNIHFLGAKPRGEIPAYVHAFDVAMIPYRASDYNRASFPLKFWEFMASGKPVVVSGLPPLEPYQHLIGMAHAPGEFAARVEDALSGRTSSVEARQREALRHSWEERVSAVERLLTR